MEVWPTSETINRLMSALSSSECRTAAANARTAEELLGAWSEVDREFYHPIFQFAPDGSVHPRFPGLLKALSRNPALSHSEDPSGWGRLGWMYQPRRSLSELSLAEWASSSGISEQEGELDTRARTPAEVFQVAPGAVIALANEDSDFVLDTPPSESDN